MLGYFAFIQGSLGPLMPSLRSEFGMSYTVASLHLSAFAGGSVLVGLFGERIALRFGRREIFWGGATGYTFAALFLVASPVVAGTIGATFLMGLLGGFLVLTIQATLSDHHGTRRAVAIAEANVAASSGAVLGALAVGGFERYGIGWRGALLLAVGGVIVLALRFRDVAVPQEMPIAAGRHGEARRLPRVFWVVASVLFLGVAAEWCVGYWGSDFLDREGGLGKSTAAAAMSAYFVAMAIGRLAGSRLARTYEDRQLLIGAFVIAAVGFLLLWLAPVAPVRLIGLFICGLGIAGIYPFTVSVGMKVAPASVNLVTARFILSGSSAILLAPFVLRIVADSAGIATAFGLTLPFLLAALGLMMRLRTR
jgi:fucose permease